MRIKSFAAIVLAATIGAPVPAQASTTPRSPTSRWVVDFADNQCVASLNFGDSKRPLFLGLKPSPTGEIMQLVVVKETGYIDSPAQLPIKIQIEDQPPREFSMLAVGGKKGTPDHFRINMTMADFAPIRSATKVTLLSSGRLNESFQLVQMPALLKAMDNCVADLKRHWNIDDDLRSKLRSRAKANLVSLFSTNDYPSVSVQKREGGVVGMVILVDEKGKPADCMVTQTSNSAALDTQACAIVVSRASYVPAVGEDGKPAKDSDFARIRWEMP